MITSRVISVVLILFGFAWIGYGITQLSQVPPEPSVLGFGPGFAGNTQLPIETIRKTFDESVDRMRSLNSAGRQFRHVGDASVWLSFTASAAVTIILGWLGFPPPNQIPATTKAPSNLSRKSVRWIGVLAASAAVLTALGTLSQSYAQRQFDRSGELQELLNETRQAVLDASTAEQAQSVLDNLENKSSRL